MTTHLDLARRSAPSLALAAFIALVGTPIAAQAQVAGAGNPAHRPTVDTAANGTPVVNIVAPTQAGVSHNQYEHFNVDSKGLILNNSASVSQTQQAGYVVGNANLANGAARIIVNEVTSQNASSLRGFTEVAGSRAEVIIANPNGISCDGCGFINTSRGTLVTGTPVFGGDGSLAAFRVTRGTLAINGAGLNGTGTDRLDLIARTVAANARVWANELNVVTGANQVNYGDLSAQAIAGEGGADGVSLDVAALGGMYANKIRLLGTEAGVGVRNAGELATQGGDFTITQAGRLELTGRTTSTGQLVATGAALSNSGTLAAGTRIIVSTTGTIDNSGTVYGTTDASLASGGALSNSGKLYAVGGALDVTATSVANAGAGDVYAGKRVTVRAGRIDNAAAIESGSELALQATDRLGNTRTVIASGVAGLEGSVIDNSGRISLAGPASINAVSSLSNSGNIITGGDAVVRAGDVTNHGQLQSGGDLTVSAASLVLGAQGVLYAGRALTLDVNGAVRNDGQVYATTNASVHAGSLNTSNLVRADGNLVVDVAGDIVNTGAMQAAQKLALDTTGALTNTGKLYAIGGALVATAGRFDNASSGDIYALAIATIRGGSVSNGGTVESGGSVAVQADTMLDNRGKLLADTGNATLSARDITQRGTVSAVSDVAVTATNTLSNTGTTVADRDLSIDGATVTNSGHFQAGRDATFDAAALDQQGVVYAKRDLALRGGDISNAWEATTLADGAVRIDNDGTLTNAGTIQAGTNISATKLAALDNASTGNIYTSGNFNLATLGKIDNAGSIYADGHADLDVAGLANSGSLRAGAGLTVAAGSVGNTGSIYTGDKASWTVAQQLANTGTLVARGDLTLVAGTLVSSGVLGAGVQADGSLGTTGVLDATVAGALAVHGNTLAAGHLALMAASLDLADARLRTAGDISLDAIRGDVDTGNASIATDGTLALHSTGAIRNRGGSLQGGTLDLTGAALDNAGGSLVQTGTADQSLVFTSEVDNTNGRIAANGKNLTLRASSITNNGGAIEHAGDGLLTVSGGTGMANRSGRIVGNGALDLDTSGELDSTGGTISVARDATLDATSIRNDSGTLVASALAITTMGALSNNAGAIQSSGATSITAGSLANGSGQIKGLSAQLIRVAVANTLGNGVGGFIGGNGGLWLHAGTLNNAGQLYAGATADIATTGDLTNSGAIQSMGASSVIASGSLNNNGGRIESGSGDATATLTVSGAALSNIGGRMANTGTGQARFTSGGALDNTNGTVGGQGNVAINASFFNDAGGRLVSGGDLSLGVGGFENSNGNVYAAGTLDWSNGGATLTNINGQFGAGTRLALTLAWLNNAGGNTSSNGDVALNLMGGIQGNGRVIAGRDLDVSLPGDFVNGAGGQFKANRNFGLHLGGSLYNSDGAALESVGDLTIDAAYIENGNGARISSAATTLNSRGRVSNRGRIEGDTLAINGTDIDNTGSLIGDTITVHANNLTNGADLGDQADNNAYQSALIAATQNVRLLVGGTFLNRDAMVFALGDIFIAANDAGGRTQAIVNRSGDIEADQRVTLAANQITNERRVFQTETVALADGAVRQVGGPIVRYAYNDPDPNHQPPNVDPSQIVSAEEIQRARLYCQGAGYEDNRCIGFQSGDGIPVSFQGTYTDTLLSYERLKRASAEGRVVGGTDIILSGSVTNDKSTVAAGNNLVINGAGQGSLGEGDTTIAGEVIRNIAWNPTGTVRTDASYGVGWESLVHDPRRWEPNGFKIYGTGSTSATIALGDGQRPTWINIDPGQGLVSRMTAGGTLEFHGQTIENTTVGADGNPISGVQLGANAGGSNVSGNGAGHVGSAGNAVDLGGVGGMGGTPEASGVGGVGTITGDVRNAGPRPGSQSVGTPDAPAGQIRVPNSGLYTTHPGSASPYLIETDPRFASQAGFLGSDYLMDRLGFNGEDTIKRLGDGFYEQRLVLDQITSLTGRRYLTDNTDAMAQYRALMDAGVDTAGKFQLSVGIALTAEQMANLTQDIVWMVSQEVNGEKVLVPVVYLSAAHAQEVAQNGAILSGKSIILDASGTLTNTGTIAASENASLKAGTLLNGGNLSAGGSLSVTAAQDILNAGTIKGGNVSLVAGNDILSGADIGRIDLGGLKLGDAITPVDAARLGLASGGSITATGNLSASAGRDLTLGKAPVTAGGDLSLSARRDLSLTATSVKAGGDAQLVAGRDLSLNAIAQTTAVQGSKQNSESTVHTVTTIDAGGSAVLAAGRDVVSEGAKVATGDQVAISAGRDVVLNAITDTQRSESFTKEGKKAVQTRTMDQALTGTVLDGTQGVIVSAGRDINATAATITSDRGGVALAAKNDVNLDAGQELHTWEQQAKSVKSGATSSTTKKTFDASEDSLAIGTLISGDSVTVAAGHDITTQGAQIGATNDLVMAAGNNLTIGTAETTHSETHDKTVSKSGLMSGGGFSVMIGGSKEQNGYEEHDSTPTGSVVGSTDGKVTLTAGNTVHITGSDVLSKDGTTIVGKDVTIDAAVATTDTRQTYKKQTVGITIGLTGGAVSAIQGAYGAAHRSGEVKDDRLKALYAAQAAQYLFSDGAGRGMGMSGDGIDSIGALGGAGSAYADAGGGYDGAQAAGQSTGISLRIGIGASSASSETKTHEERAYGSNIRSNGDVTIAATGGDLNVIGSSIDGKNVALAAANNLILLSQAEDHSSKSTNRNGSGEIGFSIGSQTGFYVSASAGMGKAVGNGTTHVETAVNATDNLTLISGNDTTIKGAQLKGDSVLANVGGNLLIESEQDTDDYASKQQQVGGTFTFGYGGTFSYSQSKVDSHYDSVNEVSGISAGKGGFDILVGGNTHLVGGVIASSADPGKNILDTGSLTWESIHNEANYSASSFGVGGGAGGLAPTGLSIPQSDKSSSDTASSIANGTIITHDGAADFSGLKRDGSLDSQALKPVFDEENVREAQELGNVAGQVGMTAVGDAAAYMYQHASTEEEQAKWADGGQNKILLHGMVGAASAALGGGDAIGGALGSAGSEAASKVMADWLISQGVDPNEPEGRQLMASASSAIGAMIGGGSGAAGALNGSVYNRALHVDEQSAIVGVAKSKGYSEDEVQAVACVIVSCLNGRGLVEPGVLTDGSIHYTEAGEQLLSEYNGALARLSDAQKADIAADLKSTGLFGYSAADAFSDAWSDIYGTKRVEGLGQAANGFVNAYLVAKLCRFGGVACGASTVNIAQQSDNISAGISTWWTGQSYQTLQYGIWRDAGLSDSAAKNAQVLTEAISAAAAGRAALTPGQAPKPQPTPQKSGPNPGAVDAEAGGYSSYSQYQKGDGSWNWPADLGFAEKPVADTIPVGTRLDRYGDTAGSFLSPVGTPYEQRSLAPATRINPYNEYEVMKPLPVIQGEIAPAFGERGGGVQMLPNFSDKVNVQWLIDNGYLKKVN
ncbi:hemagglutinin repeat-containing protein [Luteibacter aegosomatissinici]|uniref:hemagglutinin repeat-containing protein n=1 Tax=Luteibacter aegosomatissinici TaxID=2911539 RepID=UPI001FFAAF25|nr:hemagglutinin repeat-containing protein [Luteibacter aegosomatissinici]UPG94222.1 hemagglutinin repeat-containing protein [Luteibacter aegosomatissinici]